MRQNRKPTNTCVDCGTTSTEVYKSKQFKNKYYCTDCLINTIIASEKEKNEENNDNKNSPNI